ncbi:hypothetical protein K491DRAFT_687438 [Lophiostoma macrostomum CBS 122681]|uniref:Uncharacterized protein n=1 Tax=Lophiostoma macrostomum CBS 122681 TaxID=1314788 RepID=A0A6A6TRN8_9PLEO|nr:hypothetical protein K491DRAFT_687438 [Lophiostoma macrostomum CBS 122681]
MSPSFPPLGAHQHVIILGFFGARAHQEQGPHPPLHQRRGGHVLTASDAGCPFSSHAVDTLGARPAWREVGQPCLYRAAPWALRALF